MPGAILATSCGDNGPDLDDRSLWRLTSVDSQPLPAPGNATAGESWVAAVLSRPTALVVHPIGDDKVEVSYFYRRTTVPDAATLKGGEPSPALYGGSEAGVLRGSPRGTKFLSHTSSGFFMGQTA